LPVLTPAEGQTGTVVGAAVVVTTTRAATRAWPLKLKTKAPELTRLWKTIACAGAAKVTVVSKVLKLTSIMIPLDDSCPSTKAILYLS
jgi:hypothetical protein